MNIPNVSASIAITSITGVRLGLRGDRGAINFDVKAKLEEKERKSQMVVVSFNLLLTTKPSVVKFEVGGTVTLRGRDDEISKMLEIDPEIKVPYVFQGVYQNAFTAMYLLSTVLKAPPPPLNLLFSQRRERIPEDIEVESRVGKGMKEESVETGTEQQSTMEDNGMPVEDARVLTEDADVDLSADDREAAKPVEKV